MMNDRAKGFFIITFIYIVAAFAGISIYRYFDHMNYLIAIAIADLASTMIVWGAGVFLKNSSVYDPYWSVAPIVILSLFAVGKSTPAPAGIMLLLAVWFWGIRLTANWVYTFRGLDHQDWRYDKYKADFPKMWPLVNFFGINFMPTVIVYLAVIPALVLLNEGYRGNLITYLAFLVCISAAVIQFLADTRLHRFRRSSSGEICCEGLWNYSRHPNYLGEILMWWGVYFMLISSAPEKWILGIGALANTLLFIFISIPLMEKRQLENKPGYDDYMQKTNMLIPFFKK